MAESKSTTSGPKGVSTCIKRTFINTMVARLGSLEAVYGPHEYIGKKTEKPWITFEDIVKARPAAETTLPFTVGTSAVAALADTLTALVKGALGIHSFVEKWLAVVSPLWAGSLLERDLDMIRNIRKIVSTIGGKDLPVSTEDASANIFLGLVKCIAFHAGIHLRVVSSRWSLDFDSLVCILASAGVSIGEDPMPLISMLCHEKKLRDDAAAAAPKKPKKDTAAGAETAAGVASAAPVEGAASEVSADASSAAEDDHN